MADAVPELTPYTSVVPLMGALPSYMSTNDGQRVLSYQIYEQIYRLINGTFEVQTRGSDSLPIYVPEPRVVIDTCNRYTAPGMTLGVDPEFGTPADQQELLAAYKSLFRRERWQAKFESNKRMGLIRGDWAFHVVADPNKADGRRISIYTLDPASLFTIDHPDDLDRIMGYHIIDQWVDEEDNDKIYLKRLTYSKGPDPYDPDLDDGQIWSSYGIYEMDGWNTAGAKAKSVIYPPAPLPSEITALPVYLIRNNEEPGQPWGTSELSGYERILAGINQGVSDEEISLALEGLGVYVTTSSPPQSNGRVTNWKIGPGRVVEVDGGDEGQKAADIFTRVNGISTVAPYQQHIKMLVDWTREGTGTPAVATGKVDVSVAESGIALAIQLSPILGKTAVKDIGITDTLVQMYYDLKAWFAAYEGTTFAEEVVAVPRFGQKVPDNKAEQFERIMAIVGQGLASPGWARKELAKLGYEFDENEGDLVTAAVASTAAAADPFAARASAELEEGA